MKVSWSDLNKVNGAGRYPFRDGFITVLETELSFWRTHPVSLFSLYTKHPMRDQVEYVLGTPELENPKRDRVIHRAYELWEQAGKPDGRDEEFYHQAEEEIRESSFEH